MKFGDIKFESYLDGVATRINFGHLNLSVVKHSGSYGGDSGLYEIGVFDEANENMKELPGITNDGDTIKGWLSEDDVESIIKKMVTVTGTNPEQINGD
tara:strand:- start:800 stop:1093 length:294 start_codon:yes stop_codon:yes gene_type:complete